MTEFGFNTRSPQNQDHQEPNRLETIYDEYLETEVRVDIAGQIGGTGIMKDCAPHGIGYTIYLSPYIFWANENPRILKKGRVTLDNSTGAPVQIYPLEQSLEEHIEERIKESKKQSRKKNRNK